MLSKAFPSLCPAQLHHPALAASPKALAVLPATAGWFVLPHLGPTWHLQLLGEALPPHQAWGRCHPALKSESKNAWLWLQQDILHSRLAGGCTWSRIIQMSKCQPAATATGKGKGWERQRKTAGEEETGVSCCLNGAAAHQGIGRRLLLLLLE